MEQGPQVDLQQNSTLIFHFIPYDSTRVVIALTGEDECASQIFVDYDYERVTEMQWKIYIDVTLEVPRVARIVTRTGFETEGADELVFAAKVFAVIVGNAITACITAFNEQCENNNVDCKENRRQVYSRKFGHPENQPIVNKGK